jgi:hypothetical protein
VESEFPREKQLLGELSGEKTQKRTQCVEQCGGNPGLTTCQETRNT